MLTGPAMSRRARPGGGSGHAGSSGVSPLRRGPVRRRLAPRTARETSGCGPANAG